MKSKKSVVLAACAVTNAKHVNASNANKNFLSDIRLSSRYVDTSIRRNMFLLRGGAQGDEAGSNHKKGGEVGGTSNPTSKRKKKKTRKSKPDHIESTTATGRDKPKIGLDANEHEKKDSASKKKNKSSRSSMPTAQSDKIDTAESPAEGEAKAEYRESGNERRKAPTSNPISQQPHKTQSQSQSQQKSQVDKNADIIEEIVSCSDLYDILSIDKSEISSITSIQITKAYRRRAVLTHPDKLNGDRRAFDKVSEAYDVLSDEKKKKIYDKFGLEAVKDPDFMARASAGGGMSGAFSGMGGSFQDHIMKSFFGAGASASESFSRMSSQLRKNKDAKYELEVSLEDMYRGSSPEVKISQPNGPKVVSLEIPRGIVPGSSIRLSGEVDHVANATPADIIFIVRQRKHERFTRKGFDLAIEVKVSLSEAICGFQRQVVHLDGREINITGPMKASTYNDNIGAPSVIQTGDVHVLKGEGMPKPGGTSFFGHGNSDSEDIDERCEQFGDLYVQYAVEMPNANEANMNKLSADEIQILGALLDKLQGTKCMNSNKIESSKLRSLKMAQASDFGRASGYAEPHHDRNEHMQTDEEDHLSRSNGFQYSSFPSGGRRSQFFSTGSSPFTSTSFPGDDDGDVQCQQM